MDRKSFMLSNPQNMEDTMDNNVDKNLHVNFCSSWMFIQTWIKYLRREKDNNNMIIKISKTLCSTVPFDKLQSTLGL